MTVSAMDKIELMNILAAAHSEVERLKAEVARLRERTECHRDLPWCDCTALERERDEARALVLDMWENATAWTGPKASSHYRSEINERIQHLTTGSTGGSDKIDELELALQFVRHELEVTQDALDLLRAETRLADESDEVVPFVPEAERRRDVRRLRPEELGLSDEEAAEEADWLRLSHRLLNAIEAAGRSISVPSVLEGLAYWQVDADASVRDLLRFVRQIGYSLQVEIREKR